MTTLEIILLILFIIVLCLAIYFFFKGAKGNISLTRPVESRVDEYLDRRFESLVAEYALVRTPTVNHFKAEHEPVLAHNEEEIGNLQGFEREVQGTLSRMEERLDDLEKELSKNR